MHTDLGSPHIQQKSPLSEVFPTPEQRISRALDTMSERMYLCVVIYDVRLWDVLDWFPLEENLNLLVNYASLPQK